MARKAYRQRRRFRRARWAPSIQEIAQNIIPETDIFFSASTLMQNPAQNVSLVGQVFTVKNIEITFNIDTELAGQQGAQEPNVIENLCAYIMFVPQGMAISQDYNLQHPEYIMAYKYIGSPSNENPHNTTSGVNFGQQYQPIRVKTRLSRKLQTGDGVILFIKGINQVPTVYQPRLRVSGLVRWWTKAN